MWTSPQAGSVQRGEQKAGACLTNAAVLQKGPLNLEQLLSSNLQKILQTQCRYMEINVSYAKSSGYIELSLTMAY